MPEKPSWQTSTLSQAWLASLGFYMTLMLMVTYGLIWKSLNADIAKLIIGWGSAFEGSITAAYLTARKVNGETPSEERPPVEAKPPEVKP